MAGGRPRNLKALQDSLRLLIWRARVVKVGAVLGDFLLLLLLLVLVMAFRGLAHARARSSSHSFRAAQFTPLCGTGLPWKLERARAWKSSANRFTQGLRSNLPWDSVRPSECL